MSTSSINYDQLAAALLRAGLGSNVGTNAHGTGASGVAEGSGAVVAGGGVTGVGSANEVEVAGVVGEAVRGDGREHADVESWADAVEREESESSGEAHRADDAVSSSGSFEFAPGVARVPVGAAAGVKFGGYADAYGGGVVTRDSSSGYYKTVVRGVNAQQLKKKVEELAQVKVPKMAMESLAVCTFTAGTMPDMVASGKHRLRSLAAVGDASLTLALSVDQWARGAMVDSAQSLRSRITSNSKLSAIFVNSGLASCVTYAPGVDPLTAVTSATALEAIVGVLTIYRDTGAVRRFLMALGLIGG